MCLVFLKATGSKDISMADLVGVRVDLGRTRWSNAKIDQKVTNEDNFFGGEHGTKVLCLSAGQGDGALHLREPVNRAAMVKEESTAAGEVRAPVRIDKRFERHRTVGRKVQVPVGGVSQICEDTHSGSKMSRSGIGHEPREL